MPTGPRSSAPLTPPEQVRAASAIPPVSPTQVDRGSVTAAAQAAFSPIFPGSGNAITFSDAQGALQNLVSGDAYQGAAQIGQISQNFRSQVTSTPGRQVEAYPNVLHQFANYTYHVRWSLTDDLVGSSIASALEFQSTKKVVIAESGVTAGFNITDFEIENICAPTQRVQSMLHTKFKMTLKEPYGLSLIDRIYSLSRRMGVRNHLTNSTFIEIWFTGYDEAGNITTPDMKVGLYKLFRINVTKLESDTTSSGTEYNIEGMLDGMYANSDHVAMLPSGVNIGNLNPPTIGEFFRRLQQVMNDQQLNLENDNVRRIEYEFVLPNDMGDWRFSTVPTTDQRNSSISLTDPANFANPTFSLSRGMDISTVLYFVISMTERGRQFVAGEDRQPGQPSQARPGQSQASIRANGMANMFAIHARSQIVGFDYLTDDYVRKVTYTVTEYPTTRAIVDQQNAVATQQPAQQQDRQNTLVRSKRYNKVYDYIFTGTNLDVIKLDIKLEWFWQASVPTQLGQNVYSNYTIGPQVDPTSIAFASANQYRRARAEVQTARQNLSALQNARNAQQNQPQIESAQQTLQEAERLLSQYGNDARRFQERWENRSPGEQMLQGLQVQVGNDDIRGAAVQNFATRAAWDLSTRNRQNLYLEDARVANFYSTPLPVSLRPVSAPIGQIATMAGAAQSEQASARANLESLPRNRSLVAAVLNDVMSTPYFVEVNIEIRGDPYWIGLGNIEENSAIATAARQSELQYSPQAAFFYGGETGFFLNFRTGEAPNEETGYVEFNTSSIAFNGIYSAIEIRSIFKDGKFTQAIKAIKDPLLQSSSVQGNPAVNPAPATSIAAQQAAGAAGAAPAATASPTPAAAPSVSVVPPAVNTNPYSQENNPLTSPSGMNFGLF
jgi:hypothetical protein